MTTLPDLTPSHGGDEMQQVGRLQQATGFTDAEYLHESNLGEAEYQSKNLQAAYERFRRLLARIESLPQGLLLAKVPTNTNIPFLCSPAVLSMVGNLP